MLTYRLIHPELLGGLAAAGHGSKILLVDGNYPHATGVAASARRVHLNLRPGLVSVPDVLEPLLSAVNVEAAAVMAAPDGGEAPAHRQYRELLADGVPLTTLERFAFYDAARRDDVALMVATADQRMCANLLLTLGVVG
ncbi:MAG: RbsD/FucU family protein [Bifidobacteriaceae bacterium]|jgi:L-fucose mutarotase|nr:RbsD/FucU family protein [Bifidobacteriaceae bacterium]